MVFLYGNTFSAMMTEYEKCMAGEPFIGSTIGAGSVVTRSIPAGCVAVGNPCRVIRRLDGINYKTG